MSHKHFEELREWSARKHELLKKYLDGFVKILGGSTAGTVYYVDGFAGPGRYDDGAKGSPLLAAEYANRLAGKRYSLHCLNIEVNPDHYNNLVSNTSAYPTVTSNFLGTFGSHVARISRTISGRPAIFFLDPFGVKGIEWENVSRVLRRRFVTELLITISPSDLRRLAGYSDSDSPDAQGKRILLAELYGFTDPNQWIKVWEDQGVDGLIELYIDRLRQTMSLGYGNAYVYKYPIRTIEGENKYYLVFATRHPKGAILMNDIVYGTELSYERDVAEYQATRPQQMSFWPEPEPTREEIFQSKVDRLKRSILDKFRGDTATRLEVREAMLEDWFGMVKGPHFTRAFKEMKEEEIILKPDSQWSDDTLPITFAK